MINGSKNLINWWKSESLVTDSNGIITSWNDLATGCNLSAINSPGTNLLNSLKTAVFNGSSYFTDNNNTFGFTDFTILMVIKASSGAVLTNYGDDGNQLLCLSTYDGSGFNVGIRDEGMHNIGYTGPAIRNWTILSLRLDSVNKIATLYYNGIKYVFSNNSYSPTKWNGVFSNLGLGAFVLGAPQLIMTGEIAEVVVWNAVKSDIDIDSFSDELSVKFAVPYIDINPHIPSVPVLSSPANDTTSQPTSTKLNWIATSGITNYRLQVSTDVNFSTLIVDDSTLTSPSRQITGLSNNTKYYWRVSAINSVGTSDWSSVWDFTTLIALPAVPTLISPSSGLTGQSLSPVLTWNTVSNADSYNIQISTDSSFTTTVSSVTGYTGNSLTVNNLLNNTQYYWRVNSTNTSGTSVWSSVNNFTTLVAVPAVPSITLPSNGSTGINLSPTIYWNAVSGALSYNLQIATDSAFGTIIINKTGLTGSSYQVTGLSNNTQYYCRLCAVNTGGSSNWSTVDVFTTVIAIPSVPVLATPANNITGQTRPVNLTWNGVAGFTNYGLQISTDINFSTFIVNDSSLTSNSRQVTGLSELTKYYWRVCAINAAGSSAYSAVWNFTTIVNVPNAPELESPESGSTSVSVTPDLFWYPSDTALSYNLQVSTDSNFSSIVINQSGIKDITYNINGLNNSTKYYWRVNAVNVGGTSDWSTVGNFTTIIAVPQTPQLTSPSLNSVNISILPTLSWKSVPGNVTYTLQVSTDPVFATYLLNQNGITSTSYNVTGLSNETVYYWRVLASNSAGSSDWSSVWSFTSIIAVPKSPILTSPVNSSIGVSISPLLVWLKDDTATSYGVQISTDPNFATKVIDQSGIQDTSYNISSLNYNTQYYCRLNASNVGGTSDWSTAWNFTTIIAAPGIPVLTSPVNDSTTKDIIPTFSWNDVDSADSYTFQLSTDPTFATTIISDNVKDNSYTSSGLNYGTKYYWRVNAVNTGGTSNWSTSDFTTIISAPSAPTLISPVNNSLGILTTSLFTWNSVDSAVSYNLQISNSPDFSTKILNLTGIQTSSYQVQGLLNNTKYYWRVSAVNGGGTGLWSVINIFNTVISAPGSPVLISPVNNTVKGNTSLTFKWNAISGATSYIFQLATDSLFTSIIETKTGITDSSYTATGLIYGTTYYWRVSAANDGGTSNYSAAWTLTTIIAPPSEIPQFVLPVNNSTNITLNSSIKWNSSAGATSYSLQISTVQDFSNTIINQTAITDTTFNPVGLLNNTKYYCRVRAVNDGGLTTWSDVLSFTTIVSAPQVPTILWPENGTINNPTTDTLSWSSSSGTDSYNLQVSTDPTFTTTVINQTGIARTTFILEGLLNSTKYYWRVSASNAGGTSDWSDTWNFSTIVAVPYSPILNSPLNTLTHESITPTLTWHSVGNATSYTLQVSLDPIFSTPVINVSGLTNTSYKTSKLFNSITYYWRVCAVNKGGTSNWSAVWSFTTEDAAIIDNGHFADPSFTQYDKGEILRPYLFDQMTGETVSLVDSYGRRLSIPLVKNIDGNAYCQVLVKNTSNETANDITVNLTANILTGTLFTAITDQGKTPATGDFKENVLKYDKSSADCLETLLPGEFFNVYLTFEAIDSNIGIDLYNYSLDLTYTQSHFATKNLLAFYEFTEPFGSLSVLDSKNNIPANVTAADTAILGTGEAFLKTGDKIDFSIAPSVISTLFFKGIIPDNEAEVIILTATNGSQKLEFGLNSSRYPIIRYTNGTSVSLITGKTSLTDVSGDHIIGFSFAGGITPVITVDGSLVETDDIINHSIAQLQNVTIGGGFEGVVSDIALFSDVKTIAFHKYFGDNL